MRESRRRREREREGVRSTSAKSSIEKQYPLSGTSCSPDHPTRLDLPTLVSSSRKRDAFYPQTWRTKRSCGPGFPRRSTPSAGARAAGIIGKTSICITSPSLYPPGSDTIPLAILARSNPLRASSRQSAISLSLSLFLLSFSALT